MARHTLLRRGDDVEQRGARDLGEAAPRPRDDGRLAHLAVVDRALAEQLADAAPRDLLDARLARHAALVPGERRGEVRRGEEG